MNPEKVWRYAWRQSKLEGLEAILEADHETYERLVEENPGLYAAALARDGYNRFTSAAVRISLLREQGVPENRYADIKVQAEYGRWQAYMAKKKAAQHDSRLAEMIGALFGELQVDIDKEYMISIRDIMWDFIADRVRDERTKAKRAESTIQFDSGCYVLKDMVVIGGSIQSDADRMERLVDFAGASEIVVIGLLGQGDDHIEVLQEVQKRKIQVVKGPYEHGVLLYQNANASYSPHAPEPVRSDSGKFSLQLKRKDDFIPPSPAALQGVDPDYFMQTIQKMLIPLEVMHVEGKNGVKWVSELPESLLLDNRIKASASFCGVDSRTGFFYEGEYLTDPINPRVKSESRDIMYIDALRRLRGLDMRVMFCDSSQGPGLLKLSVGRKGPGSMGMDYVQTRVGEEYPISDSGTSAYVAFLGSEILGRGPQHAIEFDRKGKTLRWSVLE